MPRFIFHVDLDAFYASVEELDHPEYKGAPLVVGADPKEGLGRGVVTTANYEARKFGIRSAMPISEAYRRCPTARFVYPRFPRYHEKSEEVMAILRAAAPEAFEPASIDEAYLDVSARVATYGEAMALAADLQARIERETGLSASLGAASNKLVAKIATDLRKPRGLTGVPPGEEEPFLAPLPARKIPGVGPKTEERLVELGIVTCEQLAAAPASLLSREFGSWGPRLAQLARGIDDAPVEVGWERKSLGSETTFDQDEADPLVWEQTLRDVGLEIAAGLREEKRLARTVHVKIRLSGYETHTRARTLAAPTADGAALGAVAVELLREFAPDRPLRLLGLRVTGLVDEDGRTSQASLADWPADILGEAEPWTPRQKSMLDY